MRRRRAERCLLRARSALTSGQVEEARRACADAKEMDPTLPALVALEAEIAALPVRRRYAPLATAAVCLAGLALAAAMTRHAWLGPPEAPPHATAGADIVLSAPAGSVSPPSPPVEPVASDPEPEPSNSLDAAVPPQPHEQGVAPAAPPTPSPLDSAVPAPAASLEPLPLPQVADDPAPLPLLPESNTETLTTPDPAVDRPLPEPRGESTAIRRTLARYEAAYTDLDASAARAVWPTVDQRALARAFDGLAAQRIALNDCDVLVTGTTARANCSGVATWTAKVGGGQRSEPRRWTFELRNEAGAWQIVRAETR